jgi:hypothetical protein
MHAYVHLYVCKNITLVLDTLDIVTSGRAENLRPQIRADASSKDSYQMWSILPEINSELEQAR